MDEFDRLEPPEVKYRGRSVDELFGEVRSIVNGLPSRQAFEELVLILAAWPEGRRDALPASYLEAVRRWRPLMRMVPSAWYSARRRGEDVPWFGIVGGADIWSHGEAILEDPWCHEYEGWMLRYIPYEMSPDFEDEDDAWVRLGERFGKVEGAA